jgi:predicted nucleic acid-binding protein
VAVAKHLADKSAFEQQRYSDAADGILKALAVEGALHMTEIVALELLYSARSRVDYEARWDGLGSLPWLHLDEAAAGQALDLQRRLAERGQHRRPIPDLLIAATAIVHEATVLHYDRDFDLISEVSDLSARWIIPPGTGHGGSADRER